MLHVYTSNYVHGHLHCGGPGCIPVTQILVEHHGILEHVLGARDLGDVPERETLMVHSLEWQQGVLDNT